MKIWRITGSLARTVGDIGMSRSTGTSRQPSSTWPSALTARSSSCSQARREACSFGRKIMPTPYSPGGGSVDALRGHLGAVELVGDLDQDAGAVAHQLVGADGAAMVEVLEDLQALLDDAVRLAALDVGDEADAAGVVLVGRAVQAVPLGMGQFLARRALLLLVFTHGAPQLRYRRTKNTAVQQSRPRRRTDGSGRTRGPATAINRSAPRHSPRDRPG